MVSQLDQSASLLAHFGAEVRLHRGRAGLSQEQLGERVGYTGGLLSAVERATRMPSRQLAEALDRELATGGTFGRLWPLVDQHTTLTRQFRAYLDREPSAVALHTYVTHLVPGLLQTEAYARCVIEAERPSLRRDVVDARLAVRMTRQELLTKDDPLRLWVIMDEAVLRLEVGSARITAEQMRHLRDCIALPNVTVQMLPDTAGVTPAMGMPFIVAEFTDGPDALHIDAPPGVTIDSDRETITRYRIIFDHLRASALPEARSVEMVGRRVEELTAR